MTETKKILLIGRLGRGKSTLANVIVGTENKFEESSGSASKTRNIQFEEFGFYHEQEELNKLLGKLNQEENPISEKSNLNKVDFKNLQKILQDHIQNLEKIKYLVIDTPGIGDTKLGDNQVLDIIAEAVYLVRNGVSQVFFVINKRFDQSEMATYNLLRTIIFDKHITSHTTIVRTCFDDFANEEKCQTDINSMVEEAKDKKVKLEVEIAEKEEELKNFSIDSEQYREISTKIEQLKKELKLNITEIIESCQKRVIHVSNPPIDVKNERRLKLNKKYRVISRNKILDHLNISCQGVYKPKKLEELSAEIAVDMDKLLQSKRELAEELQKIKTQGNKNNDQSSRVADSENKSANASETISESTVEENDKQEVTENEATDIGVGEKIAQLEDKKAKLKKDIAEKERVIRQKVLKHIFNNYGDISNELGSEIFMESVIGEHKWENISPRFSDKKLVVKWLSQKFDYEQVNKWALALANSFNPEWDAGFCAWLRDDKNLTVENKESLIQLVNIDQLRKQYAYLLEKETDVLD